MKAKLLVVLGLLLLGGIFYHPSATAAPERHTLHGTLLVRQAAEFPDVVPGSRVEVRDEGGDVVASATLPQPVAGDSYMFKVPGVPDDAESYTIHVGAQDLPGATFDVDYLQDHGWRVHLGLG